MDRDLGDPDSDDPDSDGPDSDGPDSDELDWAVPESGAGEVEAVEPEWERPIDKFRQTATGTVIAAGLLGLQDALEGRPEKEEVTIVSEAPTRPVGDVDIVIDPDHPERTVAIVRRPPPDDTGSAP